ncbi:hypothetical protein HMI54_011636, partial [Coelomomyces lativittatus]
MDSSSSSSSSSTTSTSSSTSPPSTPLCSSSSSDLHTYVNVTPPFLFDETEFTSSAVVTSPSPPSTCTFPSSPMSLPWPLTQAPPLHGSTKNPFVVFHRHETWKEVGTLLQLSVPCILSYFLSFANRLVVTLFVGHLGANQLAAATLAVM